MNWTLVISFLCLGLALHAKIKTGQFINPLTVFASLWAMIFFLSGLKLYGLLTASTQTILLLFLGVLFFAMGFWTAFKSKRVFKIVLHSVPISLTQGNMKIRYRFLYVIGVICIIYFGTRSVSNILILIKGGNLGTIRQMAQNLEITNTSLSAKMLNAFRIFIIMPGSLVLIPATAIDFWFGRKDKPLFLLTVSTILLRVLSEGGRIVIVYFALHLIVCFSFFKRDIKNTQAVHAMRAYRKNKKLLCLLAMVLAVFLVWATLSRTGNHLVRTLYYYFSMQPYMFESWAETSAARGITGFGMASFNGFFFPFFYILKNLLGIPFPTAFDQVYRLIRETDSEWLMISKSMACANAYVSNFFTFYVDGGSIGVILISLIYGYITGRTYANACIHQNMKTVCIYSFILQGVIMSFAGFAFSELYYCMSIIFICLFLFKVR